MSRKKLRHLIPDLPEEIVVQIMCRLPVKSLIRFSSVSKRWHSLVFFDQQFAQSHFKRASEQRTLTQRFLISAGRLDLLYSLDPKTPSFGDTFPMKTFASNLPRRVLGSCHGFVVFIEFYDDHYLYLLNPSTRFVRGVPIPRFKVKPKTGFGYVSSTDDYKIFVAGVNKASGLANFEFVFNIFSFRANAWKRIEAPEPHEPSYWVCWLLNGGGRGVGALTNEALHWIHTGRVDDRPAIIAFDLAKEEFRRLPLPDFGEGDYIRSYHRRSFFNYMGIHVISGGCLCVSFCRRHVGVGCMEFWVMREYGVQESWTMLYKLNPADLPEWFSWDLYGNEPIFVTESGTVVLKLRDSTNKLIRIQCHKEEEKLDCSNPYIFNEGKWEEFTVLLYDETLLSLPNHDDAN